MELDTREAGLVVDMIWSWKVRVVWGGCGRSRHLSQFSYSHAERHLHVPFKTMQVVLLGTMPWGMQSSGLLQAAKDQQEARVPRLMKKSC